jgi:hypothetical protein
MTTLREQIREVIDGYAGGQSSPAVLICVLVRAELCGALEALAQDLDDTSAVWTGNEPAAIRRAADRIRELLA